jgi:hypothetical protein
MHFGREPGKWTLVIATVRLMEDPVREQFISSSADRETKSRFLKRRSLLWHEREMTGLWSKMAQLFPANGLIPGP